MHLKHIMSNQIDKLSSTHLPTLEKLVKSFIGKVPQIIVQSRCGVKRKATTFKFSENDHFEIIIEDVDEIKTKVDEACRDIDPLKEFCLCVETLLKTAEGDTLVLEAWNMQLVHSETYWDTKYKVYANLETVRSKLVMLLKSIVTLTRTIPAYKLSLGQGGTTYVILYRIYPGEPQLHQLGSNPHRLKIGDVYTPVGTISIGVAYRSKDEMTFAPQNTEKENSFMVKSDYFNCDMSPKRTNSGPRMVRNRVLRNSTNSPSVGAFVLADAASDTNFPDLACLQRTILHPARSCLRHREEEGEGGCDNVRGDLNCNRSASPDVAVDHLSGSDVSDGSDFVLIDVKPPFANSDPDTDLNTFYKDFQSAPSLSSFTHPPSLQEQVLDAACQLEKFEISMLDFDNFVDSVCQVDSDT